MRCPAFFRTRAMAHCVLSIAIGACFYACSHSEPGPSASVKNPAVGRWQAAIPSPIGLQQCEMEIAETGQITYGDSCPMPLTDQVGTITTVPNGTYAPNL